MDRLGRAIPTPPNKSMQRTFDPVLRSATPSLSPASKAADFRRQAASIDFGVLEVLKQTKEAKVPASHIAVDSQDGTLTGGVSVMEYKSETEELWLLQHPAWVRWLAWVGVPSLLMGCGYVLLLPVIEDNYHILLIGSSLFLGGYPIYKCMHALKIFPYLRSDVEFGPQGFSVYWPNGNRKSYTWLDVSSLTRYPIVGIVELKDCEDRRILAMDEHVTSFEKFSEFLVRKSGLSV